MSDGHVLALYGPVVVNVYAGPMTEASFAESMAAGKARASEVPALGVLTVIEPSMPLPDAETRAQARRATEVGAAFVHAGALVLAGEGFWASAMRSAYTALRWLAPEAYPERVFASVDEAARWLLEVLRATDDPRALVAFVEGLRGRARVSAA